jgi:hypothetical protein
LLSSTKFLYDAGVEEPGRIANASKKTPKSGLAAKNLRNMRPAVHLA